MCCHPLFILSCLGRETHTRSNTTVFRDWKAVSFCRGRRYYCPTKEYWQRLGKRDDSYSDKHCFLSTSTFRLNTTTSNRILCKCTMQSTSRRFFHWWVMQYSKPWFPFLLVITAAGILFLSALALYQDYWIYKPSKEWRGNPEDFGLSFYDNVCLKTKDGVAIHGWFIKQHEDYQNVPTLIYFHGTDKNHSFRLVKAFGYYINLRCNILLMTYRGFGPQSPPGRRPSESGLYWDAKAMMEYLSSRSDLRRCFFVYGESLGGALAIYIAEKFQDYLDGLIVENTFTSLADMMTSVFPMIGIPMKWLVRNKWPSLKRIRNIRIPILFLSGLRDGFVPPKMMRTLYEEAKASSMKKLVCFQHGTHHRTWILDGYYEAWREFLDSIIHTKTTITTNHRVVPQKQEEEQQS